MAIEILMPKLGLTMTEGTIEEWKKKEGDSVKKGEILLSVATDKLVNDVEADSDGVLLKIVAGDGETVDCKAVIGWLGQPGEAVPGAAAAPAAAAAPVEAAPEAVPAAQEKKCCCKKAEGGYVLATPYAKKLAKEKGYELSAIPATGYNGLVVAKDVNAFVPAPEATEAPAVKASPLAAKLAEDLGIDLTQVNAHGRVLAEDILKYLQGGAVAAAPEQREETVAMSGMRKAIAKNMLNSHMTSPTVSFNLSVDMSEMKAYRNQLKKKEVKVSYTDLIVKFVAKALTEFPLLNCSVEDNKIIYKHYVNMGVAVALDNGLVVPNVADADKKSLSEISAEIKELAALAREGKLPMEKLRGGTFTITNLGMYGIESFTPIINQPEVAILGVTTMEDRVVVRDGEMLIRPMMTLSLTADHRVVDGSVAAQFMQRVKDLMENPALMLA